MYSRLSGWLGQLRVLLVNSSIQTFNLVQADMALLLVSYILLVRCTPVRCTVHCLNSKVSETSHRSIPAVRPEFGRQVGRTVRVARYSLVRSTGGRRPGEPVTVADRGASPWIPVRDTDRGSWSPGVPLVRLLRLSCARWRSGPGEPVSRYAIDPARDRTQQTVGAATAK